ncbi:Hypothetical protein CAP_7208 [Chondromyces apiculatus DSM 436]|uniref:Uncharacterized protein n=1 Tax=Chondromyces apiculatus DSM 436 TaxID=1192034 RepID=A0A017SZ52_9BACT|nr:Hypothetical protein CAP_7208 [Chondromyces apiculatus DSM 436]
MLLVKKITVKCQALRHDTRATRAAGVSQRGAFSALIPRG